LLAGAADGAGETLGAALVGGSDGAGETLGDGVGRLPSSSVFSLGTLDANQFHQPTPHVLSSAIERYT
jgi:hypothetical protein